MLEEATKLIKSGQLVSLKFVTYDKRRKTGGKIRFIEEARIRKVNSSEEKASNSILSNSKDPGHFEHSTFAVNTCIDGHATAEVKKIHWFLLLEVNGIKIKV